MIDTLHPQDPGTWPQLHFAGAPLGDMRRSERLRSIASAMAENPAQSIPHLFTERYALKAAYTFFDRPEANPERLQSRHRELVHERLSKEPGTCLLVEDGSEISFSGMNKLIEGLDFIGNAQEGLQGFLLHSVWLYAGLATTIARARRRSGDHLLRCWAWPRRATGCAATSRGGETRKPRWPRSGERGRVRTG